MSETLSPYLRIIGKIANTRHPGGLLASEYLLNKTDINESWRILDLGCGAGHTSSHVAKKYGCFVNGIDISLAALEHAKALYKNEDFYHRMSFEYADLMQLPFSDGYFNAVLCESVLIFNLDKESALKELVRVLKPGGYLVLNELCIANFNDDALRMYFAQPEFGGFLWDAERFSSLITQSGFSIKVHDEGTFSFLEQIRADFNQFGNMKGVYQLLELAHKTLTDEELRQDLWKVIKFALKMPQGMKKLLNLKILAQKV